jgi:hypothetical protein
MKLEFFRQVFEKYLNTKCHENPASGSRIVPCGQTDVRADGLDESSSPFLQFREHIERKDDPSESIEKSEKLPGFKNSSLCIISVFPFRKKREIKAAEDQFHCIVN